MDSSNWFTRRGLKVPREGEVSVILGVPELRQNADHDCGRAAAEAACLAVGAKFDPRRFVADPVDGIEPGEMERQLRGIGLDVLAGNMTVPKLKAVTELGCPVLTPIRADGVGHWVVVKGVARGRVHVMDPWPGGRQWYSVADFLDRWSDETRQGSRYVRWGICVGR